jgi:hypothetical protein
MISKLIFKKYKKLFWCISEWKSIWKTTVTILVNTSLDLRSVSVFSFRYFLKVFFT